MNIGKKLGHLSYSTLVHPGDNWAQLRESIHTYLPEVKKRVSPDAPFGVSIRLAAATASELVENRKERDDIKRFFKENDFYVYTANAFVCGSFKKARVKEQVYEPDWHSEERLQYTKNVADILADLAPPGVVPSIQTVPLTFRSKVNSPEYLSTMTRNVLCRVAHLVDLESRTGRRVTLALEPEPACYLETTDDIASYFREHLYSGAAARQLAEISGLPVSEAIGALRRHVGIVYDICHQAVEYEDIQSSLSSLVDAGDRREERKNYEVSESLGCVQRLGARPGSARMANPLSCACFSRRVRQTWNDALCNRGRARTAPGPSVVDSSRDRNLHLGCVTGSS